jgi:hypothetical protein
MRKAISIICFVSISGCANTQNSAFIGATPGCKFDQIVIDKKKVNTSFCIKKIMLKPSQYLVTVNEHPVFEGTDYTRVSFEKKIPDGMVNGACNGVIEIQDTTTQKSIKTTALPTELVSGCNIQTDAMGNSLPFQKDPKCDQVFYKSLAPMLGKVYPVEIARQCSVTLDNHQIFENKFKL